MLFADPQPEEAQLAAFYAGSDRDQYAVLRYERQFLARDRRLVADLERFVPPGRLLDLGSSLGTLLFAAQERGWTATGLELSQEAVAHARQTYQVDARPISLREAAFESGAFDCVVASHTLEHVPDLRATGAQIQRILRPEGLFYVAVPNVASLKARLTGKHWEWVLPEHLWYFTRRTLGDFLAQMGFEIAEVRTQSYRPEAYFYFALFKRLGLDRLLPRPSDGRRRPGEGGRSGGPPSRPKAERLARAIGHLWPKKLVAALGWGADLQILAVKKKEVTP